MCTPNSDPCPLFPVAAGFQPSPMLNKPSEIAGYGAQGPVNGQGAARLSPELHIPHQKVGICTIFEIPKSVLILKTFTHKRDITVSNAKDEKLRCVVISIRACSQYSSNISYLNLTTQKHGHFNVLTNKFTLIE